MILKILLGILIAVAYFLVKRKWGDRNSGSGVGAKTGGTLEHNHADDNGTERPGLPSVDVPQLGTVDQLNKLPVWFDFAPDEKDPAIFANTFYEVDPTGEYIYYLAGDYPKTDNGYLRHHSASNVFTVMVSFEKDVINVAEHDSNLVQQWAESNSIDIEDYLSLTVGELIAKFQNPDMSETDSSPHQSISLMDQLPKGAYGIARLNISRNWFTGQGMKVSVVYEEFRAASNDDETKRYMWIDSHAMNPELPVKDLLDHFLSLVDRYKAMPYTPLSGSARF